MATVAESAVCCGHADNSALRVQGCGVCTGKNGGVTEEGGVDVCV